MVRLVLALLGASFASGCARAAPGDIMARLPDGRRLHFACAGTGSPTVILEAGWGGDSRAWPRVKPPLAARYRVCSYDRAGSGQSDAGPLPRDGAAIVRDLDQGLRAARLKGPFVLVGHSAGGLYVRLFADRRPRDVAGMVFVDSSVPHQPRRLAEALGVTTALPTPLRDRAAACLAAVRSGKKEETQPGCAADPPELAVTRWTTRLSELDTLFTATSDQVEAGRRSYDAMPLITLTAGRNGKGLAASAWQDLHREIAARSTRGEARLIADSTHMMMRDRPDAIIQAVDDVVAQARTPGR